MTTLNKNLEDLKFEFSDISGRIDDAFSIGKVSISSIVNNSNKTKKKNKYVNIDNATSGVQITQKKFAEAENELLKKSSSQIASANITNATKPLYPYQNNLPFGVPSPNPSHVNEELYSVKEKTWEDFSKTMGKIFQKIGKAELDSMLANGSKLNEIDVKNMVYSTCGSLSEWPQINPKSAGIGKCASLFAVFDKHYNKYMGNIDESKFYSDLMSSLHTSEIFALSGKKKTTAINGFSSEIKTYNINPNLWFPSDDVKKEAVYNGFAGTGIEKDSYGAFFSIGGLPIELNEYINALNVILTPANQGKIPKANYDAYKAVLLGIRKDSIGTYMTISSNDPTIIINHNNIVIMNNIEINDGELIPKNKLVTKKYCSLFLNQANEADINKIEELKSYHRYLFNIKANCMFPAVCNLSSSTNQEITISQARKNDIMFTQRIPEFGVILFLRKIFEEIYPVEIQNPAVADGRYNRQINIFGPSNNIVETHAGVATGENLNDYASPGGRPLSRMKHATDTISNVKQKLTDRIILYMNGLSGLPGIFLSDYIKTYINDTLMTYINNITDARYLNVVIPAGGVIPTQYYPLYMTNKYDTTAATGIITLFSANIPNYDISTGLANLNNFFSGANPVTGSGHPMPYQNNRPSVMIYRYLMYKLIHKMLTDYNGNANQTKYNFYRERTANDTELVILTQSRAQVGYNDLRRFKQTVPDINPIMVGGGSKHNNHHQIKTGGSKMRSSSKKIQKGGAINSLFADIPGGGANDAGQPRLYANRKLDNFNSTWFENAVKKYKELGFNTDYTKVKLLFDKISQITHLPLFFDSYDDILNVYANDGRAVGANASTSGGCGEVPATNTIPLSFNDIAQLFLFNSVNTTTTTLLIHFLKNVKACLNHFMTTDLRAVSDVQGKQIADSQSDKIEGSLRELVKEIDKVVNFLKYNTLNLQEQTISLNNDVAPFSFGNNQHYIKNLFLGANVFFSYTSGNANQSVVMRFTTADGNGGNWEGDKLFEFLNKIVGCTENSDIFGRTLKFLTDSNNEPTLGLTPYKTEADAVANPSLNNPYLQKIRTYIKDKPEGCFGGIPFASIDPKVFSLLMRSFYLLLGLRLVVGTEIKQGIQVEEEELFSVLKKETKEAVRDKIKNTLTVASFSTLAESLRKQETISQANRMFNVIFGFLFGQAQRLIAEVNKAKEETNKTSKVGNKKNKKMGLFTGGGPTSIYTYRPTTNANRQNNIAKSEVNFIKTTYQTMAEFEYMMNTIMEKLKEEIERRQVRNQLHFYYYIDTHFRNFKIYMETYLLTIGEKNIPPEMAQKLQQYIGYSPDKKKESFLRLTTVPLIDPQYSDPLWWAKIESKFMDIQEARNPSTDSIYRLFIITTTPANWKTKAILRDLYIIDAFALATLNNERSETVKWSSTGYRTHAGVKTSKNSTNQKIYLDSNTVIKLTGIVSQKSAFKMNSTKAQMYSQLRVPFSGNMNINKAIKEAINEDIRDLIDGKYLYYDRQSNNYKKLIPMFLQADTHAKLSSIVNFQKNIMFKPYEKKFASVSDGPQNMDYRIYEMSDDKIQDLKKYRQWLYQIFVEQQMKLTQPEKDNFETIEKTMKDSFKTFLTTNVTGKCTRVYNIYDYIILHSLGGVMARYRTPATPTKRGPDPPPIDAVSIKYSGLTNSFDMGSKMVAGFISREDLIKLMLLY